MVNVNDIYGGEGGRFLNAAICEEEGLWGQKLTIVDCEVREIKERKKLVLSFEEIDDLLVLNATNAKIIAESYGEDTDGWIGKQIILKKVKRTFQGKLVDAIEVETTEVEIDMSKKNSSGKKGKKGGKK